jgi:hypothetical protein
VSVAGLVGSVVTDETGARVGRVDDVLVWWIAGVAHPPLAGLVVRSGRRRSFVPADGVASIGRERVALVRGLEQNATPGKIRHRP